jgi:dGTPase
MTIREQIEAREADYLSPFAVLSSASRGRLRPEAPDAVRTIFQRDRDRIIHLCVAFRRLAQKTQVFIASTQDHFRTRLSHTLEVAQIARTLAKALRLNEDLAEAIALGHDVGHTPFGHAGEDALDLVYRRYDPAAHFAHHEHSVRVLDLLEREGQGLNLSWEVREGILGHSKSMADLAQDLATTQASSLEAMLVRVADRIAYVNHDLDDGLRAGLVSLEQVPAPVLQVLGERHSARVGRMVSDLLAHSADAPRLSMSEPVLAATDALKNFLVARVYQSDWMQAEAAKARRIVETLFEIYMESDEAFETIGPISPQHRLPRAGDTADRARLVADYVAGMTDRFAREKYLHFVLPSGVPSFE